jgi:quercetin dioxygenase-like cupin family protein
MVAQDPVKVDPTHYKVVLENPSVRVLKMDYAGGAKGVMHRHPDAVLISLSAAMVRFLAPDGKPRDRDVFKESAIYTAAGEHSLSNIGVGRLDGLLVELKAPRPGTAALPAARPGLTMKVLAEGSRAIAYRMSAEPAFFEPAGTKHEFDEIIVALGTSPLSLSITGKPAKTTWTRGDVLFIGRGVAHEARNTSSTSLDFVTIAIK